MIFLQCIGLGIALGCGFASGEWVFKRLAGRWLRIPSEKKTLTVAVDNAQALAALDELLLKVETVRGAIRECQNAGAVQ